MVEPKLILGGIPAPRVLDVATGGGSFVGFLVEGLLSWESIIGLDAEDRAAAAFAAAWKDRAGVEFRKGDAYALDFPDGSFDLVSVSNSLHHFADPGAVLAEMLRVARPGGRVLIAEMHRDAVTEEELTHVLLHHWWAAVDSSLGIVHGETWTRERLAAGAAGLGLLEMRLFDLRDTEGDPRDPALLAELDAVITRYIGRAGERADLRDKGEALRTRVASVGYRSAPSLVAVGFKPGTRPGA